ncbi:IS200/IS605 family transposase [Candidatus Parcubacteria bacterium]|jgi:putative transposase|nr:IS200/IS605 family transposase [Candidatus Parcubacteria bacterium]
MPNTYTSLFYHVVFSVKNRRPLISLDLKKQLYPYICGIAKKNGFYILNVNGTDDHIHILLSLKPTIQLSKAIQLVKGGSSKWIHENFPELKIFLWQEGYGAFTVSMSQIDIIKNYIDKQEQHHRKIDLKQEYRSLLIKNNVDFDKKYLF